MTIFEKKANTMVLTEAEALEFFAFLVASARAQLDDPANYASMRLLTAFEDLRDVIIDRVSDDTREALEKTIEMSAHAQINMLDKETYMHDLDALNRLLASFLVAQSGLEGKS